MIDIYEANNYDISYRAVFHGEKSLKLYTDKEPIEIVSDISFDSEADEKSAVNYFAAAIAGGILYHIVEIANKNGILLEDVEGKVRLKLKNPLSIIGVKGYEESPYIESCDFVIYLYSDMEENELLIFLKDSLQKCFIYKTLEKSMNINVRFVFTI